MFVRKVSLAKLSRSLLSCVILLTIQYGLASNQPLAAQDSSLVQPPARQAWHNSRIVGSPESPNPFKLIPAFPKLKFDEPMQVRWSPALQRYFVCELRGKIWSFANNEDLEAADLVVDLKSDLKSFDSNRSHGVQDVYSIAFDPDFENNRFLYVCMVFSSKLGKPLEDGTRVSRFKVVGTESPKVDLQSELPIIQWLAGGHNGCDLLFDNSGCLLISTGDATEPSPPDRMKTGQDISDLLASILRIDVRGATASHPYKIPEDNPFHDIPNARKEIWAFGFRNPWRMTIDRLTDNLLVGDVGWEKWEMIHRVSKGGNHGWSVREGNELIQSELPLGPAPITAPWIALSHAEAASITGGFVYRGNRLTELSGKYLFGDWVSGRIWGMPLDTSEPEREIASSSLRIIAFEPDSEGEPLVVNHFTRTTLYRLVANERYEQQKNESAAFPRKLSETGLFENIQQQEPAVGVLRFSIQHPMWQDGASAEHYLGLPGTSAVTVYETPQPLAHMAMFASRLHYPAGTVLAKTLRWKGRFIETQLLHFDGARWHGYSFQWNKEQTDAELVPREGKEIQLSEGESKRWRFHSRTECFQCHNPWPETTLAFTSEQLHDAASGKESTWNRLQELGYIQTLNAKQEPVPADKSVRLALHRDVNASIEDRARSYLHVNCAHCHQFGAGTGVAIDLRRTNATNELKMVAQLPEKGDFGFEHAKLIDPGRPENSILMYRLMSSSVGHMPHIGSREVDFAAVTLLADWIQGMDSKSASPSYLTQRELEAWGERFLQQSQGTSLPLADARRHNAMALAIANSRKIAVADGIVEDAGFSREKAHALANDSDPIISSLFEAFLPEGERVRRLSAGTRLSDVENVAGDIERGKRLFHEPNRLQCARCHQVGDEGGYIGPRLDAIGLRLAKSQLFEAIAEPSRVVDSKYQTQRVMTEDGTVLMGLVETESENDFVMITSSGEKVTIPIDQIAERELEKQSLMPSGLLEQMTTQELADLLAYLGSLR